MSELDERSWQVEVAGATRELMLAAATTCVGEADRDRAMALMAEATQLLGKQADERVRRAAYDKPAEAKSAGVPHVLGAGNPASIPLEVTFNGDAARASTVVNALFEGPPDSVHGGTLAWLMDCMTGILVQSTLKPSVTGTLSMRYLKRTPLDQPLELGSRILSQSGRKTVVEAWVEHAGERTLECSGIFVEVPFRDRVRD